MLIVVHERVTWLLEPFLSDKQGEDAFIGADRLWFARKRLAKTCLNSFCGEPESLDAGKVYRNQLGKKKRFVWHWIGGSVVSCMLLRR